MPVRRMTLQQAIDLIQDISSSESSDDDFELPDNNVRQDSTSDDEQPPNIVADSDGEVFFDDFSDSSSSDSEETEEIFVTSNNIQWTNLRPQPHRLSRNIIRFQEGPTFAPNSEKEAFHLFVDDTILRTILRYTNRRIRADGGKKFSFDELKAGIAVLIRAGADKDNLTSYSSLFHPSDSRPFYRCAISKNRFKSFLKYVTFDNKAIRRERQCIDSMAAIREVWEIFQGNLKKWYTPSPWLTVDEQLYGFRGYSPGRAYMKSKPARYGIKFFWLCDARNGFALAGEIYSGRGQEGRNVGLAEKIVLSLTAFYADSGRNIFTDRYFTSYSLCSRLLEKRLTLTGTILSTRREVPLEMRNVRNRELFSTKELWDTENKVLLLSWVPKKGKNVLLLSSLHNAAEPQQNRDDKKPLVIHDYNTGKGGVDLLDSCIDDFSCKRKTNRYPLVIFFNILDISVINAFIIFKQSSAPSSGKCRRDFMKTLAHQLAFENMQYRFQNVSIYSQIKDSFSRFGMKKEIVPQRRCNNSTPRRCTSGACRRSTRSSCNLCGKYICTEHKILSIHCSDCNR